MKPEIYENKKIMKKKYHSTMYYVTKIKFKANFVEAKA
jgi:hypothetical protein